MGRSFNPAAGGVTPFGGQEVLSTFTCPPLPASANDYSVAGQPFADASLLIIDATVPINLTGLVGATANRELTLLLAAGSAAVTVKNASGASLAKNRFQLGSDQVLEANQALRLLGRGAAGWVTYVAAVGSGAGSPLTTKGDVYGFSNANARIPVGPDGEVLTADSTNPLGVSWQPGGVAVPGVPATIPDLQYWWQGNLADVTAGNVIQRFFDSGPWTGNHAGPDTLPAVVASATQLDGKNIFTWPGAAGGRAFFATPIFLPQSTVFMVIRTKAGGTIAFNLGGTTGAYQITQNSADNKIALVKSAVAIIGESSALAANTALQFNATYDDVSGDFAFRIAQANDLSGSSVQSITEPSTSFGWSQGDTGEDAVGDMAEMIIYSRVLTLVQIEAVEAYLNAKWGV